MGFIEDMLREGMEEAKDTNQRMDAKAAMAQASDIVTRRASYEARCEFKPGDLVEWKPGLKNKNAPDYGQPCVVMEVLPGYRNLEQDTGTPYHREPLDLAVGMIYKNGDFVSFHFDSARFRLFQPGEVEGPGQ